MYFRKEFSVLVLNSGINDIDTESFVYFACPFQGMIFAILTESRLWTNTGCYWVYEVCL